MRLSSEDEWRYPRLRSVRAVIHPDTVSTASDLMSVARTLRDAADPGSDEEIRQPLDSLRDAALDVGAAWSGSALGYHARVYYGDFDAVPPGAGFSSEWGFQDAFSNYTRGDWREYAHKDVVAEIRRRAGNPDLAAVRARSTAARETLGEQKAEFQSILTAFLADHTDALLEELKETGMNVLAGTEDQFRQAATATGQLMSRDMRAITDGVHIAPHLAVIAEVLALEAPFISSTELAAIAQRAATHVERLASGRRTPTRPIGTAVFIGHGRSLLWRELKDFIHERLGLPWDEFNRVPVAGTSNVARLVEMLDSAAIAFLVLTAEDEQADGAVHARQNVVHEAGLFQGRLGFHRAIVLLEEGCEQFSNIEGLGQIRFPASRISAAFEEIRLVLEREGLLAD